MSNLIDYKSQRARPAHKILLIEPPNNLTVGFNATVLVEPLGLEYIAGSVSDIADVRIYDMRVDPKSLEETLIEYKPNLVGISEKYTVDVNSVKDVARQVKKIDSDILVVAGGHHVSLSPTDAYTRDIDAIVVGKGEIPFRELVETLNRKDRINTIQNVIFKDEDGTFNESNVISRKINSLKEFNSQEMNVRPKPRWDLVDYYRSNYHFLYHTNPYSVETTQGCMYRCNFCSVWRFHNGEYRVQSIERTLEDIGSLPKGSWVNIVDDLAIPEIPPSMKSKFPSGYDPMEELAERLEELNLDHRYWMQVRADNVVRNQRKFKKWTDAGLDTVLVGIESFEEDDLNAVRKGTHVADNIKAIKILHDYGIRIWGGVIIFQHWGEREFYNLKKAVHKYRIEFPQYTIFTPLPGTDLYEECKDKLLTRDPQFYDFFHSVLPTRLPPKEFYGEFASLWPEVGTGGRKRVREMSQEIGATLDSIRRFLQQYKTLSDLSTYKKGIELQKRALTKAFV